ncbi:MAG TPA: AAA family ATPase [Thermoanaerobaculia bacterium]|nr:AAA family ATPase [Thermoanaerobaculia bacterium]
MSKVRVRLLGGFEVWQGDQQVAGFESQKVRALLAYLICNRQRAFSRDHLAGLLWPEREPEAARHALRQAVYNLKATFPNGEDGDVPPILSNGSQLQFNPEAGCWLDIAAFEDALQQSAERRPADPHHLASAVQLYRGELLSGFFVRDSEAFEEWLVTEQERLREAAIEALRALIDNYRRRGEYRFGIHYARRLTTIDPLSEEAYRYLMQLCAMAGRRNQALAYYEELQTRLEDELGVEPLDETRAIYESILIDVSGPPPATEDTEPIGPLIPLVGRGEAYVVLWECWQRVLEGTGQLILVEGEAGVGKTRLVKSFLDAASAQRRTVVLKGRCYELAPTVAYLPFSEALRSALTETDVAERALSFLPPEVLEDLARLVPDLRELRPELPTPGPLFGESGRLRLFESVARFLEALCRVDPESPGGDPLVIFLDDLHLADRDTFDLLRHLALRLEHSPIWIILTYRSAVLGLGHPLLEIAGEAGAVWMGIGRLDITDVEEIAQSLVGESQAIELAQFLDLHGHGLPLAVAELINFLWDGGLLAVRDMRSWRLAGPLAEVQAPTDEDVSALILRRIRKLPNSTKRLASLAAIAGQHFDADLLQQAAEEHPGVVEIGLEVLLKRWLIRQFVQFWTSGRREHDVVLWAQGVRRGSFEFAHKWIRNALYYDLNPIRRQAMHTQVAEALESLLGDRKEGICEALAWHYSAANQWDRAAGYLVQSAEKARNLLARETALHYCDKALEALARLTSASRTAEQADRWMRERLRIERLREEIEEAEEPANAG